MITSRYILLAALFFSLGAAAQNQSRKLRVVPYAANIFKVTLTSPRQGWHNENISDAVLLKPQPKLPLVVDHLFREDYIVINKQVKVTVFDSADYAGLTIALKPGEKIFGGGERALPLNRRGYRLPLYNNPWYGYAEGADALNYSVPFVTSSKGYGLFFDNPSKGYIDIGKSHPNVLEYGASSGEINVYIIFGDYQTILQSYYKLTGTQPLPPRWAFGHFLSRFGYTSEAQVRDIYQKTKAEGIPVDAVIFDLFWFGDSIKHTLGNLDWVNKKAWPNPKKMIGDFKKDGVNTILVTEPFFLEGTKNYTASKPFLAVDSLGKPYTLTDFYFGRGGLIDIFRNDSKAFFWTFYKQQMLNGVEGWWGDLGEPEKHPANLYHNLKDLGYKRLFAADEVHNVFGHNWTKLLYENYAKDFPAKRLFSLNRSGFAGTQRYGIIPWTGDVSRSWSGLRAQLPILLGMSMSGVPYVHSDAGGFAGGDGDPELYVRWLQMAAFTPIFRPHGTALFDKDTAALSFPSEVALMKEPWKSDAKLAVTLRYAMAPYNYSLAYHQAKYGKPLMAPLYYHFSSDTIAAGIEDEYMWGENILVAPVLEKGAKSRKVYLPKGKWMNIRNQFIEGGRWIDAPAEISEMSIVPFFIREGSFIPSFGSKDSTLINIESLWKESSFLNYCVSKTPTSFVWYNDDGVSKNSIATGNYTLVKCTGQDKGKTVKLTIEASNKRYLKDKLVISIAGLTRQPELVLVNGRPMNSADIGPFELSPAQSINTAHWRNSEKLLQLHTQFGNARRLVIEITK